VVLVLFGRKAENVYLDLLSFGPRMAVAFLRFSDHLFRTFSVNATFTVQVGIVPTIETAREITAQGDFARHCDHHTAPEKILARDHLAKTAAQRGWQPQAI